MAVKLHAAGESHLKGLIDAGKYETEQGWDFSTSDEDALLGTGGDDWSRYSSVHLGEDDSADDKTKARWKYPAAKADGDSEKVYRSGLIAAKDRAAQQGEKEIEDAAGRLIDAIDEKENGDKSAEEPEQPEEAAAEPAAEPASEPSTEASRATIRVAGARDLPRVMTRIFGSPLLIAQEKLDVIMAAIGPRLSIKASPSSSDREADLIGMLIGMEKPADDEDDTSVPYAVTDDGIALIGIEGTLVYKSSWLGALSGLVSYSDIGAAVDKAIADPSVKGILLVVDSYGGECNGSFDLSDAIFEARQKKPICGVAADDAYSAAFLTISAASKVYVSRTSGVGSVGVVALHIDQSAADKERGLKYDYVYAGARKIDGNPHAPLSTPARDSLQAECDRLRSLFASSVAKYRGLSVDEVLGTEAGCYYGDQAVTAKFADAVGTPADALAGLREMIAKKDQGTGAAPILSAEVPAVPVSAEIPAASKADAKVARHVVRDSVRTLAASKGNQVVDLDAVRKEVRGEVAAETTEILALCKLAGHPEMAADFVQAGQSVAQVRTELQNRRVAVSDARRTQGHIMPDADTTDPQTAAAGWEKAFAPFKSNAKGA